MQAERSYFATEEQAEYTGREGAGAAQDRGDVQGVRGLALQARDNRDQNARRGLALEDRCGEPSAREHQATEGGTEDDSGDYGARKIDQKQGRDHCKASVAEHCGRGHLLELQE